MRSCFCIISYKMHITRSYHCCTLCSWWGKQSESSLIEKMFLTQAALTAPEKTSPHIGTSEMTLHGQEKSIGQPMIEPGSPMMMMMMSAHHSPPLHRWGCTGLLVGEALSLWSPTAPPHTATLPWFWTGHWLYLVKQPCSHQLPTPLMQWN